LIFLDIIIHIQYPFTIPYDNMSAPGFSFLRHAPAEGNRYIFRHQFSNDEVDCESCDKCGDTVDDILERGIDKILCNVPAGVNTNQMNVDSSVKNAKKHAHTFLKGVCQRCNLTTTEIISLPIDQVMCAIAPKANASEKKYIAPVSMQRKMAMRDVMRAHLSENSLSQKMKAISI